MIGKSWLYNLFCLKITLQRSKWNFDQRFARKWHDAKNHICPVRIGMTDKNSLWISFESRGLLGFHYFMLYTHVMQYMQYTWKNNMMFVYHLSAKLDSNIIMFKGTRRGPAALESQLNNSYRTSVFHFPCMYMTLTSMQVNGFPDWWRPLIVPLSNNHEPIKIETNVLHHIDWTPVRDNQGAGRMAPET